MAIEIERKFLVTSNDFIKDSYKKTFIKQGFLNSNKKRVVRVRTQDNQSFLTIKGVSDKKGISRFEWEKSISNTDAEQLYPLCEKEIIEKHRYLVKSNHHTFEIDVFLGNNQGLIIAEIELSSEDEIFIKPKWLGKEVTGENRYYNTNLSILPYKKWK